MQLSKKHLLLLCKTLGLNSPSIKYKSKEELKDLIKEFEDNKNTKVLQTGKQIKFVYHAADIHIRTLERHEEYRQVFDNLYKYLQQQDNLSESVFVICGDIFHNRDRLISETIILFNNLLEKLTEIIDVILIPGNHDIFSHNDRLDTISGIVNIKAYPRFYFLKYSGIYHYHNINFVVSSLVDNKFISMKSFTPPPDTINIALYHGSLSGSKLDNDYIVPPGELFTVKDFKGFDYVLLGDIHKRQYLANNIAYSGSLIQQNFKEEIEHGIIKWDIINNKSEFVNIHNDYSYITLHIKDNSFPDDTQFSKFSRIKLIHEYTEDNDEGVDYTKIKDLISQKTNILSISKEISNVQNNEETKENTESNESLDKRLFTGLISKQPENIKKELLALHLKYLDNHNEKQKEISVNKWYLKKLEYKNVYIYGGNHLNTVDFESKQGVIGILHSNAAGKSSIMNIILYTLFGTITKNKSFLNRNIINKNSKDYYIKMTIQMGNQELMVIRQGKNKIRKDKSKSMDEKIEFYIDTLNATDTDKIATQEKIKTTLGLTDKDLFILTNVINYSMYISLLNMTSSDIGNVFSKLFNLEHYKSIYTSVLKESKIVTDKIKVLKGKQEELKITEPIQVDIDQLTISTQELELIESKLNKLIKEESNVNIPEKLNGITYDVEEEKKLIKKLEKLPATELTLGEINRQISSLKNNLENAEPLETEESQETLNNKKKAIKFHKTTSPCTVAEYRLAQKVDIDIPTFDTKDLEYTQDGDIIISKEKTEKFKELLNVFNDTTTLQKYVDTKLLINDYIKHQKLTKENKELQAEYDSLSSQIRYIQDKELNTLISYKSRIITENKLQELKQAKEEQENIIKLQEIKKEKSKLLEEKKKLTNEIKALHTLQAKASLIEEQNKTINDKVKEIKKELTILHHKESLYKIYKGVVNDKSLPKLILSNTIKQIEKEANKVVYSLAGLMVYVSNSDTDKADEGSKWEILIKKNGMTLGSEQVSGYERFVINVALKMALDKYKFYSGSSIFFIDEAFDCVAEDNFDKIDDIFAYLKTYYRNILIVSHNEELKKKIDHRINISTDFMCSKIIE